ncbi:hypothetical protein PFISCL1PPCAC_14087, partial [Pristionchus fissidentatus]
IMLVNWLKRNQTDEFFPLFEIIYAFELFFIVLALFIGPLILAAAFKSTSLNRNVSNTFFASTKNIILQFRLHIFFGVLHTCVYISSRLIVMVHQYLGTSEYGIFRCLLFSSASEFVLKNLFYFSISIIAWDRWMATKYWAWYESGVPLTLIFFVIQ